ncbi:MAG TPA: SDR family oxidoreductase [Frankiaceae bacterium]|nr:SDR family oxidoreductase [Frankiaceae bacterium]
MKTSLDGRVVVVLGASSGIGRATAARFAKQGATVVCAARGKRALDATVSEITQAGGRAFAIPTDAAERGQVDALARQTIAEHGRIDVWLNAVGIASYGAFEATPPEEFERVLRVNLLSHVWGAYAALPHLRESAGTLVGIASVFGTRSSPLLTSYCASKWGLRGFYDALRMELRHQREPVRVTTILPSSVDTPLFVHARSRLGTRPRPIPPVYDPEVVAAAIVRAARRPTREVVVGGAGAAYATVQRIAPALSDATSGLLWRLQHDDRADDAHDNLDEPVDGAGAVRGGWKGHVSQTSAYTALVGQRPWATRALVTGAGLLAYRRLRRCS